MMSVSTLLFDVRLFWSVVLRQDDSLLQNEAIVSGNQPCRKCLAIITI